MDRYKSAWKSRNGYLWIGIVLIACLVYSIGCTHESIWFDEVHSAVMARHSFSEIIRLIAMDKHPPLYFLLLRVVSMVLGTSDWALRALSVAGAVSLIALGAGPVRRNFGDRTAYIYAALSIFTPGILIYAHEARMYTLAIFTVTASALYGYLAARQNRTSDWIWFGLFSLAAAYLHYYALIAVFNIFVLIFLWLVIKMKAHLKPYLFTGGAVFLFYLPWVLVFVKQINLTRQASFFTPVNPSVVMAAFHKPFAYKFLYPEVTPIMNVVAVLTIGMALSGLIIAKRKKFENKLTFGVLLLLTTQLTIFIPILISRILTPVFSPRYTLVNTGMLVLLLSLGISVFPKKGHQLAAVMIFAFLNTFAINDVYTQFFNDPVKDVYLELREEIQPGDLVITTDAFAMGPMLYYFPQAVHCFSINDTEAQWKQLFMPFNDQLYNDDDLENLLSTHQSFWYITSNSGWSKSVWTLLNDREDWVLSSEPSYFSRPFVVRSFTVEKYTYIGH